MNTRNNNVVEIVNVESKTTYLSRNSQGGVMMNKPFKTGKHNDIIEKHCYKCGHDKFFSRPSGLRCSKCRSPPTKIETYTNKHKKKCTRVIIDDKNL